MTELLQNLGIDWRLLIAQAINFLIVLWLLNRFVFKKIISYLEDRKNKIEQGLELTEKAKREIQQISEARQREIKKTKEEADRILSEARNSASEKEKVVLSSARSEAEKMMLKAKDQAEKEKLSSILSAKLEIQKLSVLIAEKLLKRSTKPEDQESAAKEILDHLENQYATK